MSSVSNDRKVKVLVVDDSRVVRVAASRMFGDDFDVLLAVDGADALSIIERDSDIHVVFSDLAMPEMDGYELLTALREHTDENIRTLPIIIATGAGNPEPAKKKAFSLGATDFITKPFNGTDLRARARSYAQFREANKELKEQATIDTLTSLLNLRGIQMQLNKEISFAVRHESNITLMCIEIDRYKDLFVRIGRHGTETLIKKVSTVLEDTFRKEDSLARVGLARFIVSMPLSQTESARDLANRICQTIESFKASLDGKRIKITVSIGVCAVESDEQVDVDFLLGMAFESLERALRDGASQLKEFGIDEYRQVLLENAKQTMSVDSVLEAIEHGDRVGLVERIDNAIDRLSPLFAMLSNEQIQRIVGYGQGMKGNIVNIDSTRSAQK
ncbi:MAG: hypothetical protein COA42_20305 [Alteromonadaceae bacterium]|nr:MAG: hypothetical protein COA42_20305 [Alteromonadaceae bacterium]